MSFNEFYAGLEKSNLEVLSAESVKIKVSVLKKVMQKCYEAGSKEGHSAGVKLAKDIYNFPSGKSNDFTDILGDLFRRK